MFEFTFGDSFMKRGFTLIEMLVGLLFVPMILGISLSIMKVMDKDIIMEANQTTVFELQMKQYLIHASQVRFDVDMINGSYGGKEFEIVHDRDRLIKRPGYEILLEGVQRVGLEGKCFYVYLETSKICITEP